MNYECANQETCEIGAMLEEARLVAAIPDETLTELGSGWETAARVVMSATMDTLAQVDEEEITRLTESLPNAASRCDACPQNRNGMLRALLGTTPDSPADL